MSKKINKRFRVKGKQELNFFNKIYYIDLTQNFSNIQILGFIVQYIVYSVFILVEY